MLRSFADKDTDRARRRERSRRLDPTTQRSALRKLLILDASETLDDARIPPGSRLEKLGGDRAGQHSIRVNQPWRICFRWTPAGAEHIEITALRLARYVGTSERFGMNLQGRYDLEVARDRLGSILADIHPLASA